MSGRGWRRGRPCLHTLAAVLHLCTGNLLQGLYQSIGRSSSRWRFHGYHWYADMQPDVDRVQLSPSLPHPSQLRWTAQGSCIPPQASPHDCHQVYLQPTSRQPNPPVFQRALSRPVFDPPMTLTRPVDCVLKAVILRIGSKRSRSYL